MASERVRVCEVDSTPLKWDLRVPGYEYSCPTCGRYEEFFGATAEVEVETGEPGESDACV